MRKILLKRDFKPQIMNRIVATVYRKLTLKFSGQSEKAWKIGIFSTVHKSGNGLNYNPHVHAIAARELLNIQTGELIQPDFLPYNSFRKVWRDSLLRVLVRHGYLTSSESRDMKKVYTTGFTVHFQVIDKTDPKALYRTAQYLASGFFHNSMITNVDHAKRMVTFRHRSRLNMKTREKKYSTITLPIYEFMARMLFYLPDHHQKSVRYYGFYASSYRATRIKRDSNSCSWLAGIQNSFVVNPENCPDCGSLMHRTVLFWYSTFHLERQLNRKFILHDDGYYRTIRGP